MGFLLTELLRHDYCCKSPRKEIIDKITFDNNRILRKEIEILNPDALVFLTGPTYDKHIRKTYPMATFSNIDHYPSNQVSIIENIPYINRAIRIYHPDYHKWLGSKFRFEMVDVIKNFLAI
ncbi:hypothetical protein [Rufibacter sp. LB8]|uniref:hypothetical protein n=1 Tax=Rufibacter sp. LB8 TaxID=2777781 RepID=UPI00178C6498|nr:hypothetical protein [Rufibacter sp. LB8]